MIEGMANRRKFGTALVCAVALVSGGCAAESPRAATDQPAIDAELEQALDEAEPTKVSDVASDEPKQERAPFDPDWLVEVTGFGPIRIGMSVQEVVEALDGAVDAPEGLDGCDYIFPRGWPEGISLMVVQGRVARIEVGQGEVRTAAGARIGASEQEIRALYRGQVEVRPHKYTDGNVLIVSPAGPLGAEHRIVFETNGSVVERYRAGVLPAVEWVEGCA